MDEQNISNIENLDQPIAEEVEVTTPKKSARRTIKRIIYILLLVLFISVFVACAIYIANYMVDSQQASGAYDSLAGLHSRPTGDDGPQHTLPEGQVPTLPDGGLDPEYILPELKELYEKNKDLVGWINVPGTNIDYPVVQTPSNPNYYLYRGFDKKYSSWGCLYVREICDVFTPSDNVVIYGHHMKDNTMFAQLDKYKKKAFWEDHQTFTFDTLYERHTYQIVAVFKTSANIGQGFSYHTFNDAKSEEEFNDFMKQVHKLQFYDTGVTAEYGDMLLTLSTCEYTLSNGRFVVVAKRIS